MKNKIKYNIKQRYLFQDLEKERLILKSISKNLKLNQNIRWKAQQKFLNYSNNSSMTRIKNICVLTGRSKSVYRLFKISRIKLRKLVSYGTLSGIFKYNW